MPPTLHWCPAKQSEVLDRHLAKLCPGCLTLRTHTHNATSDFTVICTFIVSYPAAKSGLEQLRLYIRASGAHMTQEYRSGPWLLLISVATSSSNIDQLSTVLYVLGARCTGWRSSARSFSRQCAMETSTSLALVVLTSLGPPLK